MERTGPQVQVAPTRCPYCHEGIPRGEQPAVCPGCHALHHVACLDEAGACAACGRRAASPEDSKLTAALRARASARVVAAKTEDPALAPATSPRRPVSRVVVVVAVLVSVITAVRGGADGKGLLLAVVWGVLAAFLLDGIGEVIRSAIEDRRRE